MVEELEDTWEPLIEALGPLLASGEEKKREWKKRRSPFQFQSIHPADCAAAVADGWELVRTGKKKAKLRRQKRHDKLLEDRVWCFLYRMGYHCLNEDRFKIRFERDDGTTGLKQIDVFCCDAETSFVIECKSREVRGRRSLQKDLHETISLQNHIRQSIYSAYRDRPKPKIIWVYATSNIIWSEPDVERAASSSIQIITENEIQYYEAFLKHMGPAGKYQILGEFLRGQKVPGLGEDKIPAIRGKIGGQVFFSFVITPRRLLKIAFVNHQALNHPDGRPAYQRMVSSSRLKEIANFIRRGGYFPTNLLINLTERPRFDQISDKHNSDPNIKFGWITLPAKYRSAWIIDGQHRLFGYSALDGTLLDQSLLVVAFEKMETIKEADLFITINHKQKSVPKSLLVSLLADIRMGDAEPKTALVALASAVVRSLYNDKTSPFFRRFSIHGVPPEQNQNLTVSEVVNGLVRSGLLGRVVQKVLVGGPLSGRTDLETIERARRILNGYFEDLRVASPIRWEAGKSAYVSVNPGIRAHLVLIGEIVSYLSHKRKLDFVDSSEEEFVREVCSIARPMFAFFKSASETEVKRRFERKFGEGGVKEYVFGLSELIFQKYSDFGSDDFRVYLDQKGSEQVDEANRFVIEFADSFHSHVIHVLKAIHGTRRLTSGEDAYWDLGIENRKARMSAYERQQADPADKRLPKEAYLDLLDLKDIIRQKNNWSHFENIYSHQMPDERAGKTYYLDWIDRFNEVRRIAAHKSSMRTYQPEDFDFLEWLRTNVAPAIPGVAKA